MDCGKTERIIVEHGKRIMPEWYYYGKINVNGCKTSKYFLRPLDQTSFLGPVEKIPNDCYDPQVKPKYVEMWTCPECVRALKENETAEPNKT